MKKLKMARVLSVLAMLGTAVTTGIAAVACNSCASKPKAMNAQVLVDLGIYETTDAKTSKIEATFGKKEEGSETIFKWSAVGLDGLNAGGLLGKPDPITTPTGGGASDKQNATSAPQNADVAGKPAKSQASYDFLTGVLKLKATGEGDYTAKLFDEKAAAEIKLAVVSVTPKLKATEDKKSFVISEGYATIQWKSEPASGSAQEIGSNYSVELKADDKKNIDIASHVPAATLADFDTAKGPLSGFAIGKAKTGIKENADVTAALKADSVNGKLVKQITDLTGQKLKITVSTITAAGDKFAPNDTLKLKIILGEVEVKEVELKLEEAKPAS